MDTPISADSLNRLPTFSDDASENQNEPEQVTFRDHLKNPSNYRGSIFSPFTFLILSEWDNKLLGDIKRSIDSALKGAQTSRIKRETNEINVSQIKPTIPSYSSISFVGSSLRYNPASTLKNDSKSSLRAFKFNEQGQTPKFALQQLPLKSMKDEDWETNQSLQSERVPTNSIKSHEAKNGAMRMKKHRNSESTNLTTLSNDGDCESVEPQSACERRVPYASSRYAKQTLETMNTQEDEEEKTNVYEKEISELKQELVNKDLQMKGLINLVKQLEKELAKTRERNEKENETIDSMRDSICRELDQLNETLN